MMPSPLLLTTAQRLQQQGEAFCLVSVLRVQPPASARPGDKALVTAERIVEGWIGGGCAQPAVQRTVRQALADGRARIIRISPSEQGEVRELQDVLEFGMACHSGGTLELFVDPVLPQARLLIVGDSPLAAALASLAPRVGLPVTVMAHEADAARFADAEHVWPSDDAAVAPERVAPGAFVVVATQGRRDLQGLRAALAVGARRIFFVASARKAGVLKAALIEAGHDAAAVQAIVAPAGQPIGAQTPAEIALSVLAAVVASRRAEDLSAADDAALPAEAAAAEPVASVVPATAEAPAAPAAAAARSGTLPAARAAIAPLPDLPATGKSCCGG